jgi:hypothetical protein
LYHNDSTFQEKGVKIMKKIIALVAVVMAFASAAAFAEGTTPVKLSLVPRVGIPAAETVHGLDLGILGSNPDEVQGIQLAMIYAGTKTKMVGIQYGFVCIGNKVSGVQLGFYNSAEEVTGLQWGFINVAETMKGVQIGLVNIIKKNGALPFMVIVNAGF